MSFGHADAISVLENAGYKPGEVVAFDAAVDMLIGVADDEGSRVDDLEFEIEGLKAEVEHPELIYTDCVRCGKYFQTHHSVKYCSVGCELGYAPGTWWR